MSDLVKVSKRKLFSFTPIEPPSDEIIKLVYDKPFNFMFINTDTQRIFKNFDELIIED